MRNCPKCGARYADDLAYCPNDGTATVADAVAAAAGGDILVGTTIDGRYKVEARIGEGGMGVVYRASHVVLKKLLAIKVMRGDQAHDGEVVQRFVQEAQASSAIGHPNIIGISDFGTTPDGSVYFAMEYLEGQTLGKAMEEGPIPMERAIGLFTQITSALDAAHQRGIVHRDLKPDNIFLAKKGNQTDIVKVLDFGIAKVKNAAAKITRTGMVFGTPHYMSPEQAAGQAVDHRSDIYSLGVIMFQVFAGQLPFDAESYMGVMTKHMFDPPPAPSTIKPSLRGSIEDVILAALAKKPEHRYQSMLEIRDDLERIRKGERTSATDRVSIANEAEKFSTPGALPAVNTRGGAPVSASAGNFDEASALSNGDSIVVPIKKRPIALYAGIGGAVLVGIIVMLASSGTPAAKPQAHTVAPAPEPSAATASPSTPKTLHVSAQPADAELRLDGAVVGRGEAELTAPLQGSATLAVSAAGYVTKSLTIDATSSDPIQLALEREPVRAGKPAPASPVTPRTGTRKKSASTSQPKKATEPAPVAAPKPAAKPARRATGSLNDVVDPWQ